MPSNFGADYSRYLTPVPGEVVPFPTPQNDAQRMANARARAQRAGVDIGSGFLNPQSGELQDPDRGFGRAILSHPEIMIPAVLAGGFGIGALGGSSAGPALPALGNVNAVTDGLAAGGAAGAGAGASAALGGAAPAARSLTQTLTSADGIASLASIIPALLASRGGGSDATGGSEELRRINAISEAQMRRADPLHQVATNLAFSRMPMSARQGVTLNNVPLPG